MCLYAAGAKTIEEIAAECEVSPSTVQREARRRGLSRR